MCQYVADSAKIGKDCILGRNVVIMKSTQIGDNAYIGHNVVIHEGTKIGSNVYIGDHCILGQMPRSGSTSHCQVLQEFPPLEIGDGCVLCSAVILYAGVKIGNEVLLGDQASIRQGSSVGDKSTIGRLVSGDPDVKIGSHVKIEATTTIAGPAVIEDNAFIGTGTNTTNDNNMARGQIILKGPHIKKGARVGSNVTLLPGVVIGEESIVAAGSVVTKDVPPYKVVMGVPAKVVKDAPKEEVIY